MKKVILSLAVLAVSATAFFVSNDNSKNETLFASNLEALAESEIIRDCDGCSTEKEIYCCAVGLNGAIFFLFRD